MCRLPAPRPRTPPSAGPLTVPFSLTHHWVPVNSFEFRTQQYDQTGFPQNVQQTYHVAPQQQSGSAWPFGDSDPIVGGAPGADGGVAFSGGGYPNQGQQQQQQQQQPYQQEMLTGGVEEQSAEASKVSKLSSPMIIERVLCGSALLLSLIHI